MSYWHPIWTPPSEEEREAGRAASERAAKLGGKTDVERGLIAALAAYYDPPASTPAPAAAGEPAPLVPRPDRRRRLRGRALAYEKGARASLPRRHPDDVEVGSFYALALLATHVPTDASLKNPLRAAEILEGYYARTPTIRAVVHYLIHAYDYPPVAARGLAAARSYAAIAPGCRTALHMPAHIFTRLGMWNDVIASNLASADAARQYAASHHPQATSFEELHALDYLVYGYLQRGDEPPGEGRARAYADGEGDLPGRGLRGRLRDRRRAGALRARAPAMGEARGARRARRLAVARDLHVRHRALRLRARARRRARRPPSPTRRQANGPPRAGWRRA
jgi:hypothetical protein